MSIRFLVYLIRGMELIFIDVSRSLRGGMRGNIISLIFNLFRLRWLLDIYEMLNWE